MDGQWFGAWGQWIAGVATIAGLWVSLRTAVRAEKRAKEAHEAQLKNSDSLFRRQYRPLWYVKYISVTPSGAEQILNVTALNVGLGPAFDLRVEVQDVNIGIAPEPEAVRHRYVPYSTTGQDEVVESKTPWRADSKFRFKAFQSQAPIRSGRIRLSWRDRTGEEDSQTFSFELSDEGTVQVHRESLAQERKTHEARNMLQ